MSVSGDSLNSESLLFSGLRTSIGGLAAVSISFWTFGLPGSRIFGNGWNNSFQIYCTTSDARIYLKLTTGFVDVITVGNLLGGDTWKHVLITWAQNGTAYIYLNGAEEASGESGDFPIAASGVDCRLFREGDGSSYGSGVYEDFAFWNRQLGLADAHSLYNGRLSAAFIPDGLLAHYPLNVPGDGVYGAVADGDWGLVDRTGQQVPATIETAPDWAQNVPGLHWPSSPVVMPAVAAAGPGGIVPVAMHSYRQRR